MCLFVSCIIISSELHPKLQSCRCWLLPQVEMERIAIDASTLEFSVCWPSYCRFCYICEKRHKAHRDAEGPQALGGGAQITDARHTSLKKCLQVIHISQSLFFRNKLDKCIKTWLDVNTNPSTSNRLKICHIIIVVHFHRSSPAHLVYKHSTTSKKEEKEEKGWRCSLAAHLFCFKVLTWLPHTEARLGAV